MSFDEENYEDELDRMRARKQKKKSGRRAVPAPSSSEDEDDFQIYEDVDSLDSENNPEPEEYHPEDYFEEEEADNRTREFPRQPSVTTDRRSSSVHNRPKRKKRRRRFLWKLLIAVLILFACYTVYNKVRDDGYWTIAVFGVDSRDGNLGKGALSDVEMLCSIDKKTGEIRLVSVFRDTYMRIDNENNYHKINEAYFKGGHQQALDALRQNLDLQIDDYATFNWKAVVDAINVLGGVDLEITDKEFAFINSFITETVNSTGVGSHQLDHSGMNHLDGVQAVAYARLRLMDTDFNRTERQRKVLQLAMDKAKSADFKTLKTLVGAVYPQVSTSVGVDNLIGMAKDAHKYYIGQTSGFPFSHTEMKIGKMDCVIPATLESNVVQLHSFLYQVEKYTPSATVKKISSHIAKETGIGDPGEDIETNRPDSGKSSGGTGNNKPAATEPVPAETSPAETESVPEESSSEEPESSSAEETTIEALENTQESRSESDNQSGPGIPTAEAPTRPVHTDAPETPTTEEPAGTTGVLEGPGQGNSNGEEDVVGPGV